MWLTALSLIRNNWKIIAILAFIFGWSLFCYQMGRSAVIAEWEADKAAQILAIQAEKDRLQDEANKKSKELEDKLSELKQKNQRLNRKLANEIKANQAAYSACALTPASVQLWNTSAEGSSAK